MPATGPQPDTLGSLARAAGVATDYVDWSGEHVDVDPDVVATVLGLVGGPAVGTAASTPTVGTLPAAPRCWGWSVQLYALHSEDSWGIGDFHDLREFAAWSGRELGAGLILINPVHAVAPVLPIEASPYFATSRRYINPLYLRIDDLPEYASAPKATKAAVDALRIPPPSGLIDRDEVWQAKSAALELLYPYARPVAPDADLGDFATFCALAEIHGLPWQRWPASLHRLDSPAVAQARVRLATRVRFHVWVQHCCDEQLAAAQRTARSSGMPIGIVHDLAVGVDPGGADSWALQDVLGAHVAVGAPPDGFNQLGQNWSIQPWRPDRLAAQGFAPLRTMLEAVLAHGGGLRVDHIMGLFRMWWVPQGEPARRGTYVAYDAPAMLDVLVTAAAARGALVIGEDLGTVEPHVREALSARGILGSAVLWCERQGDDPLGAPKSPANWRELAAASISTHDLPTAAGFLAGEHVQVRAALGQLSRPVADEQRHADAQRGALLELLIDQDLLAATDADDVDAVILAMHRLLAATPSRVLLASPYDVVGERRQPNLPGTTSEYPNWRIPLPMSLAELRRDARVARTAAVLSAARPPASVP